MSTIYVAGPMSGYLNLNFPAFNKATDVLRRAGYTVINPAEEDRKAQEPWISLIDPDYADEKYPFTPADTRRLIRRDVDIILSLRVDDGDMIVVLDGFRASKGANAEIANGRWAGLPILKYDPLSPKHWNEATALLSPLRFDERWFIDPEKPHLTLFNLSSKVA